MSLHIVKNNIVAKFTDLVKVNMKIIIYRLKFILQKCYFHNLLIVLTCEPN